MPPAHRIELPDEVLDQIDGEARAFVMLSAAFRSIEDDKEAIVRLLRYAQHRWGAAAATGPRAPDAEDVRDALGAY